jgi:hypothetical protein
MHAVGGGKRVGAESLYGNTVYLRLSYRERHIIGKVFKKNLPAKPRITHEYKTRNNGDDRRDNYEFDDGKAA